MPWHVQVMGYVFWRPCSADESSTSTECNPSKKKRKLKEEVNFCTLKCKLKLIVRSGEVPSRLETEVVLAHEIFKRTTFFFRLFLFCLARGEAPCVKLSIVKECINRVCMQDSRGAKPNDTGLGIKLDNFWKHSYSAAYPTLIEASGRNYMKQLVAKQILNNILVDTTSRMDFDDSQRAC